MKIYIFRLVMQVQAARLSVFTWGLAWFSSSEVLMDYVKLHVVSLWGWVCDNLNWDLQVVFFILFFFFASATVVFLFCHQLGISDSLNLFLICFTKICYNNQQLNAVKIFVSFLHCSFLRQLNFDFLTLSSFFFFNLRYPSS